MSAAGEPHDDSGTVYLIHLDTPYRHARHYTGWAKDLDTRLEAHRHGHGARLMQVIKEAGISWRLARTWPGTKTLERAIKDRHNAPRLCPGCTPRPQPVTAALASAGDHAAGPTAQPRHDPVSLAVPPAFPGDLPQPPDAETGEAEMEVN